MRESRELAVVIPTCYVFYFPNSKNAERNKISDTVQLKESESYQFLIDKNLLKNQSRRQSVGFPVHS